MKQLTTICMGLFFFSVLASASTPSIDSAISELDPDSGVALFRYENGDWTLVKNQCREGYNPAAPKEEDSEVHLATAEGSCESL